MVFRNPAPSPSPRMPSNLQSGLLRACGIGTWAQWYSEMLSAGAVLISYAVLVVINIVVNMDDIGCKEYDFGDAKIKVR